MSRNRGAAVPYKQITVELFQDLFSTNEDEGEEPFNVGLQAIPTNSLDFSGDPFQLQSLEYLNIIGLGKPELREKLSEFHLARNQLTSLTPLAYDVHSKVPNMFPKIKKIDAAFNTIGFLCAGYKDVPSYNEWPCKMECLTELNLQHNQLTQIPGLKSMPNLKMLNLSHNRIRPPWKALKDGHCLEVLKLHENKLNWTPNEFIRDLRVVRHLTNIKHLTVCDNPFCRELPKYDLYVIHEIAEVQQGFRHQSRGGKQLETLDGKRVLPERRQIALNISFSKTGELTEASDDPIATLRKKKASRVAAALGGSGPLGDLDAAHEPDDMLSLKTMKIPTVEEMSLLLQDCFAQPTRCISKVHDLMKKARAIMFKRDQHDKLFNGSISTSDLNNESKKKEIYRMAVLEFLQHLQLLMQRQPQLMPSLLRVLANLASVEEGQLGDRCIDVLQDVMKSGTEQKALVIQVMDECVIPQLNRTSSSRGGGGGSRRGGGGGGASGSGEMSEMDKAAQRERVQNERVRLQLIRSMERLAEGSNMGESLSGLAQTLVLWMCESASPEVISMCAVATMHKKNAVMMAYNDAFVPAIMDELSPGLESHNRSLFYKIVRLITNLCRHDAVVIGGGGGGKGASSARGGGRPGRRGRGKGSDKGSGRSSSRGGRGGRSGGGSGGKGGGDGSAAKQQLEYRSAGKFVKKFLHERLLQRLKDDISIKKSWDFAHNRGVSRIVDCLAALSLHPSGMFNLLRPGKSYLESLFQIYSMVEQTGKHVHPIVVSSVINAMLVVLQHDLGNNGRFEYSKTNTVDHLELERRITQGIGNAAGLLRFLNEDDHRCYRTMCDEAMRQQESAGNESKGAAGDSALVVSSSKQRIPSLRTLHNDHMCELLVSVIRFVGYYCEAAETTDSPVAIRVAKQMNDNDREECLFNCILCPSDKVKLSVVDCLYHVPLAQLDEDETSKLVNMLNEQTNISAGETEKVIAMSFDLLSKMVLDDTVSNCEQFRIKQAEHAIRAALDILGRNSDRDTRDDDEEDAEKYTLSHACVNFLRACSVWGGSMGMITSAAAIASSSSGGLRQNLKNKSVMDLMRTVLCLEDKFSKHYVLHPIGSKEKARFSYRPVLIERTWAGADIEYLLHPFVHIGQHAAVTRAGVVAPRLYRRMADVLLGLPDPLLSDIKMAEMKLRARQNNDEGQDDGDEDGGGGGRSSAKKGSRGGRKNLRGGRGDSKNEEKEAKMDDPDGSDDGGGSGKGGRGAAAIEDKDDAAEEDEGDEGEEGEDDEDEGDDMGEEDEEDDDDSELRGSEYTDNNDIMHPELESLFLKIRREYAKMDESVARDIEMESIQRERRMDDWWFDSDDPLSSGKIKESVEASRHRLVQHATIVEHTDTISQMIIFMAKELTEEEKEQVQRFAGGEGKGESPDGSSAAGIQQVAFPAKSYVANLDEQISTLISLEHRRARAERLLRRNRATGSAGGAGASMLANVSGAGGSNMMLAGQSQMAGRKLLLQAFMMETDDVGGGKGAGGGTADAARAASQASSADDAASVGFSLSTDENPQSALVAAAMRVFFCLLRFGFKDTCRKARNQLSEVTMFRRLANISTGDSRRPMWWDYLLGAKFLAVAQEVIRMSPLSRSAPTQRLELYAITSRYARGVLRGVMYQLEHKTEALSSTDMKCATMAACAAAMVARQLSTVVLPRSESVLSHASVGDRVGVVCGTSNKDYSSGGGGSLRAKALEYMYSLLFPRSVLTAFIRYLLYDMSITDEVDVGKARHRSALKQRRQCREAIIEICVQFLTHSERNRYMVLEQLCREEYENDHNIRQALLQDMLRGVSDNTYRAALQNYMDMNGMFKFLDALSSRDVPPEAVGIYPGMTAERIIVSGWVTVLSGKDYSVEEVPNYGKLEERLLVVTNYQIYLLKHPYLEWKPCQNCAPDKFCPKGPELDYTIRFDRVQRMTYGFTGQWFHLGLSGADARGAGVLGGKSSGEHSPLRVEERSAEDPSESLHVYCPRRRLCSHLSSAIKSACDDWERHNISSLGANATYQYPPPDVDVDMAMRMAISSIVQFSRAGGTGGGGGDITPAGGDGKGSVGTKKGGGGGGRSGGGDKGGDANASARGDRYKEALLVTFVKVYRGAAGDKDDNGTDFQDKLLILTKKHIIMADFDPRSWSFPINWSLRREIYLKQHARKMRRLEDIINRTEKETKQQNLLQERQKKIVEMKLLKKSRRARWSRMCNKFDLSNDHDAVRYDKFQVFVRKEIAEAAFAKKTSQAAMWLSFKTGESNPEHGEDLFPGGPKSRGDRGHTFLFASDSLREEWRTALQSSLKQLDEPTKAGR